MRLLLKLLKIKRKSGNCQQKRKTQDIGVKDNNKPISKVFLNFN
jgi:hypothetical protein